MATERPLPLEFAAIKEGDTLKIEDHRTYLATMRRAPAGRYIVLMLPEPEAHSLLANKFYHGTVVPIAVEAMNAAGARDKDGLPYTDKTAHKLFKDLFNGGRTTTDLPAAAYSVFTEHVMAHTAQEYGAEYPPKRELALV